MKMLLLIIALIFSLAALVPAFADPEPDMAMQDGRAEVKLAWQNQQLLPGQQAMLGVIFDIQPLWHIQAGKGSGDDLPPYIPTSIKVTVADGWETGKIIWPTAHIFTIGEGEFMETLAGYEGEVLAAVPIDVPSDAQPGEYEVLVSVVYQACDDKSCEMPLEFEIEGKAVVVAERDDAASEAESDIAALFAATLGVVKSTTPSIKTGWWGEIAVLLLAALGGFLLNLTPCVLPVIPLKIMSLAQQAQGNRSKTLALGIAMCAGVTSFWLGLGVAVGSISEFTTNELFQYPAFPITVGVVIALMAIGMCGLFTMQLPQWVYKINPGHDSYHGSFAFGIMTAVLSTPCTAPFMGAAIAGSVGQSLTTVLLVFGSVGMGMSLPYFVLAAWPQLIAKMPRTGPASVLIKQVMGLLMLAAAAYFIGVGISSSVAELGKPASLVYWWAVAAMLIAAGGWLGLKTFAISKSSLQRSVFGGVGLLIIVVAFAGARILTDKGPIPWKYYTADERLQDELEDGKVVVLKFTAGWCVNCLLLEKTVFRTDALIELLLRDDVTPMKVDISNKKAPGTKLLAKYWRSIPYLVILRPDGSVAFEADWYTANDVISGIEAALSTQAAIEDP
ncbi:MAG: hypothetical protein IH984_04980 [Planctomycetes bacterium]|nr:hypothetical protein [Planctomycetota bacterium]